MKKFIAFITVWLGIGILIIGWTQHNLSWLLTAIKGQTVEVSMWLSAIVSIVFSGIIVAINIIIELLKLIF